MKTVSVVMSVFNSEKYLRAAMDSVLLQTYKEFEFIIVNDGSTDNSVAIMRSYRDSRIKIIEQNNSGLAIALNNGINYATGEYLARMDADDICMPQRFEKQVEFLSGYPDHVLIGSNAIIIDQYGNFIYNSDHPCSWEELKATLPFPAIFHSSVMLQRDAVINSGKYDETVSQLNDFEDLLLWNKLVHFGKLANLKERLIQYRLLPSSSTTKIGKLSYYKRELINTAIETGAISSEQRARYLKLKTSLTSEDREKLYHKYLAKKYLFNNFQPGMARKNLFKATGLNLIDLQTFSMLLLSFLPEPVVKYIYRLLSHR